MEPRQPDDLQLRQAPSDRYIAAVVEAGGGQSVRASANNKRVSGRLHLAPANQAVVKACRTSQSSEANGTARPKDN